jgi:hypothetical protein
VFGHPFTESYARLTTPKEVWHTPEFRRVNRLISAAWGLAFLVGTLSLVAAAATGDRQILLRWIIPIGALYGAFHFTQDQQAKARKPHRTPSQVRTSTWGANLAVADLCLPDGARELPVRLRTCSAP